MSTDLPDCLVQPAQFEFERLIRESPTGFVVFALVACYVVFVAAYWLGYYRGVGESQQSQPK